MRHTIIIALLLITLFPNTALAQWGFDAVSVEAYINDHKKQRSLLLAFLYVFAGAFSAWTAELFL